MLMKILKRLGYVRKQEAEDMAQEEGRRLFERSCLKSNSELLVAAAMQGRKYGFSMVYVLDSESAADNALTLMKDLNKVESDATIQRHAENLIANARSLDDPWFVDQIQKQQERNPISANVATKILLKENKC